MLKTIQGRSPERKEVKPVRKLFAVCLTPALVLGLVAGSLAFDTERIMVPASDMQKIEVSLGGLHSKDECWIWMDQYASWIWLFTTTWFGPGCGFKKYVDPSDVQAYTDCVPPYFPFNVESMEIAVHVYNWPGPDSFDVVIYYDIETIADDPYHPCTFVPGEEVWHSEDLLYSLPPGWYGWFSISFPCIWVYEPFMVSWHIVTVEEMGYFGWITDYDGIVPCWNWLNAHCLYYYDMWLEFDDIGWDDGDLLFGVDGRPEWNVAVDMGSFEAVPGNQMVTLRWRTESETDNDCWIITRDGQEIARLDGQGKTAAATEYKYVDNRGLVNGMTYSYMLTAVGFDGQTDEYGPVIATPLALTAGEVPGEFALSQNYPNPFNASTVIRYQLASDEHVTLKVYNIKGQEVASLVDADQKAGLYTVNWMGQGVSSGLYFYTLTAGDFIQTKKMAFIK